jgi:hypothetical protein
MENAQNSKDTTLKRAVILEEKNNTKVHIFNISIITNSEENKFSIQLGHIDKSANKSTVDEIINSAISNNSNTDKTIQSEEDRINKLWNDLIDLVQKRGYFIEEIPLGDIQEHLTIDLETGQIISTSNKMHNYVTTPNLEDISRNINYSIGNMFNIKAKEAIDKFEILVQKGKYSKAISILRQNLDAINMNSSLIKRELLDKINLIPEKKFKDKDRHDLYILKLFIAETINDYEYIEKTVSLFLKNFKNKLKIGSYEELRFQQANAAYHNGKKDLALFIYKELMDISNLRPYTKAKIHNNFAVFFTSDDFEKIKYLEIASDNFLQSGHRIDAAKVKLHIADSILKNNPDKAMEVIESVESLVDFQEINDYYAKAKISNYKARVLFKQNKLDKAIDEIEKAIKHLEGLYGESIEQERYSNYGFASILAKNIGKTELATYYENKSNEIKSLIRDKDFILKIQLGELFEKKDFEGVRQLKDSIKDENDEHLTFMYHMIIAKDNHNMSFEDKINELEQAKAILEKNTTLSKELWENLSFCFAEFYIGQDEIKSIEWYKKTLSYNPLNQTSCQKYAILLQKYKKWDELEEFCKKQLDLRGELSGWLYLYGESLYNNNKPNQAMPVLSRSMELSEDKELKCRAEKLILDLAKSGITPDSSFLNNISKPQYQITLEEFETCLNDFILYTQQEIRMQFWEYCSKEKKYKWTSKPENVAKRLFQTYLKAKFGENIGIFDETPAGAGRIDLYIKFAGNLKIIVELKICGEGYTSGYALEGIEQLDHYLNNRNTHIGYLLVFDARKRDFGKDLNGVLIRETYTIFTKAIDLRYSVKEVS